MPTALRATRCGGVNRSPDLRWSAPPAHTASLALIIHDPDAPLPGGFYHWVVYNIAAGTRELPTNVRLAADQVGEGSAQRMGYWGPCPPPTKVHHYHITLYALDLPYIGTGAVEAHAHVYFQPLTGPQLEARIAGHILATALLIGTSSTPETGLDCASVENAARWTK
jgi:Raf kinase inhibitor-like YbhB/YbcL family protein